MNNNSLMIHLVLLSLSACSVPSSDTGTANNIVPPDSMQKWQIENTVDFSNYTTVMVQVPISESIRKEKYIFLKIASEKNENHTLLLTRVQTGSEFFSSNLTTLTTESNLVYEIFTNGGKKDNGFIKLSVQ